ncbi:MAG: hypothetical protein ACRC3H_16175 [Lachnospiraceae bacterium]
MLYIQLRMIAAIELVLKLILLQIVGGTNIRCKNQCRAVFNISMLNRLYNMRRIISLKRMRTA